MKLRRKQVLKPFKLFNLHLKSVLIKLQIECSLFVCSLIVNSCENPVL